MDAQPRTVKNTGPSAVHFARIEFLGSGLAETWGTTGLSPNYKLLIENQYTRVYDIRIPAGTREPQHTHHDRVVVCLSGAQLKHLMPDGREEPSTLKTGEIVWRRGGTHIGQNLGKTDLWVIAVEPK
jgi:quercetin dioxygenase-like cupin family protein